MEPEIKSEKCIEQPCPFQGYTDTKKCWFHSRNVPLPEDAYTKTIFNTGPMTFEQALTEEEANKISYQWDKTKVEIVEE